MVIIIMMKIPSKPSLYATICILQSVYRQYSTVQGRPRSTSSASTPGSHLNQQTQHRTKDSGFYLYFFIVTDTVTTTGEKRQWEGGRRVKNKDLLLLFISSLPPAHRLSPSPSLITRFEKEIMLSCVSLLLLL